MSMSVSSTSGQFLTVPTLSHRSSHHHRRDSARTRAPAQSPQSRVPPATRNVASSSRVKLEDTPLGMDMAPPTPRTSSSSTSTTSTSAHTSTTSTTVTSSASSAASASSPTPAVRRRQTVTRVGPAPPPSNNMILPAMANSSSAGSARSRSLPSRQQQQQQQSSHQAPQAAPPQPQPQQLSPRSIFRAMPFLLRLRSPPSDLLNMTCTSGGPRTHTVLNRSPISINKASQPLVYNQTLVCEDAVNAEVLLRLARNELLERAQQTDRRVTALVDEEWRYTIRQTKNGDYNVQVFYSACPAQCESQNSNETVDPRKPVALSHVNNIPGLMRVLHSE